MQITQLKSLDELRREVDMLLDALDVAMRAKQTQRQAVASTNRADPYEPYRSTALRQGPLHGFPSLDLGDGGRWVQRCHGAD
jgi:hypothetical protein